MEFVWNDGGRSAAGYVGLAGDCVTRSIAIATGKAYRDVYQALGVKTLKSPRNGVDTSAAADYLTSLGWRRIDGGLANFNAHLLPKGIVIVELSKSRGRSRHFCTLIDHVVHDTWNPADDACYVMVNIWSPPGRVSEAALTTSGPMRTTSREQELTQKEFEKILRRLRALDNTANNHASTEGEKRNALRMMQSLMLTHNLKREDIVDEDNVEHVQFTRIACPLNRNRACTWEKSLAWYVVHEIFPTVQWYMGTRGHRTFFWFYGPVSDVENCILLFRELLLTIATAAQLQYGGFVRGSGASYAEGYVAGLPRSGSPGPADDPQVFSENALIHSRTLALQDAAKQWLSMECDTQLSSSSTRGRYQHDSLAANRGQQHGSKQEINFSGRRKRITHK